MLLDVGIVARAHGLKGQVVVELITNRPERVAPGAVLHSERGPLEVLVSAPAPGSGARDRWVVTFRGVDGRPAADALRGVVLRAEPIDDPDALWVHELIGARVCDVSGLDHGVVTDVQANPASDLLVLEGGGLVPLRFVVEHAPGRIVVDVPVGLLDG